MQLGRGYTAIRENFTRFNAADSCDGHIASELFRASHIALISTIRCGKLWMQSIRAAVATDEELMRMQTMSLPKEDW